VKQFRKLRHLFIWLVLPATFALLFNNTSNKHYHLLPNGEVIVHSHPFNKDTETQHSHTSKELSLFAQIFNSFTPGIEVVVFSVFFIFFIEIKFYNHQKETITTQKFFSTNRSPPLSM